MLPTTLMESLKGDGEGLASGMGVGAEPGEAHAVGRGWFGVILE